MILDGDRKRVFVKYLCWLLATCRCSLGRILSFLLNYLKLCLHSGSWGVFQLGIAHLNLPLDPLFFHLFINFRSWCLPLVNINYPNWLLINYLILLARGELPDLCTNFDWELLLLGLNPLIVINDCSGSWIGNEEIIDVVVIDNISNLLRRRLLLLWHSIRLRY